MSIEIADAYVTLHTKMPGVKSDIQRALGSADAEGAGRKIGKQASDGAARGFALGGAVAGVTAVLTAGIANSIGALVGEAVKASDATDKFKQTLNFAGVDGTVIDGLTKSTRTYADQTVYDLATIQGATAQLAANGVKDYDKLVEAAGNLNAVAGGNADTFGSVSTVLTQVAGAGRLMTQDWNQIANAIPGASGIIQKALLDAGAYTGNFREAMEKGQITAEEFNAAVMQIGSTPIAVEAAKSTATFEGAIGNLQATIVGGFGDALNAMKPFLTGAITGLSDGIGAFFGFLADASKSLDFSQLAELAGYLSPLGLIFKVLEPVLPLIVDTLSTVASVLGGALMSVISAILPVIVEFVNMLADLAAQIIPMLFPVIVQLAGIIGTLLTALAPIVVMLIQAFMPILEALIPVIMMVLEAILPLISALLGAFAPVLETIVQVLAELLVPILDIVIFAVKALAEVIKWAVTNIIMPLFEAIIPIIQNLGQVFQDVFKNVGNFLGSIFSGIASSFKGMINFLIDLINGFLAGLNEVGNFISDATGGAIDFSVGRIPHLAEGGTITRAGTVLVGERGPELLRLPAGASVDPNIAGAVGDGQRLVLMVDGQQFDAYVRGKAQGQIDSKSYRDGVAYASGKASL